MSFWPCGSVKVFAGSAREIALPSVQVWFAVGAVTIGAPRTVAEKVSDTDSPLVSVAVTVMPRRLRRDGRGAAERVRGRVEAEPAGQRLTVR